MSSFSKLLTPEAHGKFELPVGAYYIARWCYLNRRYFIWWSRRETKKVKRRHDYFEVDRPIYVTGLARAGTTITTTMLSQHPDVATHRYLHIPNPFIPYWWDRFVRKLPLGDDPPVERFHKDGIMVTKSSPEALEEPLWKAFFKGLHDEERCCVLDDETSNPKFEDYYRDHIWKVAVSQDRTRYATKANYNVTRMEYLLRLIPDARFVLVIRNPVNHVASYLKQNRVLTEVEEHSRRMLKATQILGHHEFGKHRIYINVGDADVTKQVRQLEADGKPTHGCAHYWASVYDYVADRLEANPGLAKQVLVVRYEDLCGQTGPMLDRIIEHTSLDSEGFAPVREEYVAKPKPPTYYTPDFSDEELEAIAKIAGPTAARFGYEIDRSVDSLFVTGEFDLQPAR